MTDQSESPAEPVRRAVFAVLVQTQDEGLSPVASRLKVAVAFGVHVELVHAIEREGLENEWPPL
jgi:hypothetical protein